MIQKQLQIAKATEEGERERREEEEVSEDFKEDFKVHIYI